mmetsp:Transcript_94022/g.223777  ORF Transcript_94022/g.223777 Transcript_94022/m.223777 type:complete len:257 (-) Transcript_94022:662-1432(-)
MTFRLSQTSVCHRRAVKLFDLPGVHIVYSVLRRNDSLTGPGVQLSRQVLEQPRVHPLGARKHILKGVVEHPRHANLHLPLDGLVNVGDGPNGRPLHHQQRCQAGGVAGQRDQHKEGEAKAHQPHAWATLHWRRALAQEEVVPNGEAGSSELGANFPHSAGTALRLHPDLHDPQDERHAQQKRCDAQPRLRGEGGERPHQTRPEGDLLHFCGYYQVEVVLPQGRQKGGKLVPKWCDPQIRDANVEVPHGHVVDASCV